MKDQSRRIDEHLWYAGQRGDHDRPRLSGEWTEAYAKKWRRWRIEKYLFCVDKCAAEIIAILLRPHADSDRRQGG